MGDDYSTSTEDGDSSLPKAGRDFPWENISGFCLRFVRLVPLTDLKGDTVGPLILDAYGMATMELPNPDLAPHQRLITVPIQAKADFKSIYRAQLDGGVREGSTELVVVYEHRRGFFGGPKPGLHIAAYPIGTWKKFFEAVSNFKSQDFVWSPAIFLYQPTATRAFPAKNNLFSE